MRYERNAISKNNRLSLDKRLPCETQIQHITHDTTKGVKLQFIIFTKNIFPL